MVLAAALQKHLHDVLLHGHGRYMRQIPLDRYAFTVAEKLLEIPLQLYSVSMRAPHSGSEVSVQRVCAVSFLTRQLRE
jgi:hypothetical protein